MVSLQKGLAHFVLRENKGEIHRNNLASLSLRGRSHKITLTVPLIQLINSKFISQSARQEQKVKLMGRY